MDYARFLREFALPGLPVIITGASSADRRFFRWVASRNRSWEDLDYFRTAPHINRQHVSSSYTHDAPFKKSVTSYLTIGDALDELYKRGGWKPGAVMQDKPKYLANWAYDKKRWFGHIRRRPQ